MIAKFPTRIAARKIINSCRRFHYNVVVRAQQYSTNCTGLVFNPIHCTALPFPEEDYNVVVEMSANIGDLCCNLCWN